MLKAFPGFVSDDFIEKEKKKSHYLRLPNLSPPLYTTRSLKTKKDRPQSN